MNESPFLEYSRRPSGRNVQAVENVPGFLRRIRNNDATIQHVTMHCGESSQQNERVLRALQQNKVLKKFTMRCLSHDDSDHWDVALAFSQMMQMNKTIRELAVYSRTPSDVCDAGILMGLSRNHTLQKLNLEAMSLDGMGGAAFGLYLASNKSLKQLQFSDVHFATGALSSIGTGISKNRTLQILEIGDCSFRGGSEEEMALDESLAQHISIQQLKFERNTGLYHRKTFVGSPDGLMGNKALRKITYAGIDETNGDFRAIKCARGLGSNSSLVVLDLHRSGVRDPGAVALSKALISSNWSLKELLLGENQIGDAGATAFGFYLARNLSLELLDLQHNHFADAGAVAIGRGLRKNSTLKCLNVARNPFSMVGYDCIFSSLHANPRPSLQELGICALYVGVTRVPGIKRTTSKGSFLSLRTLASIEEDRSDAESIETLNSSFHEKNKHYVPLDALSRRAFKDRYFNSIRFRIRKNHAELLELEEVESLSPELLSSMLRGDHGLYLRFDLLRRPLKKKVASAQGEATIAATTAIATTVPMRPLSPSKRRKKVVIE